MLPRRFYKIFGLRVTFMEFGMATYYRWNKKTEQLVPAKTYEVLNMWMGFYGGGIFFIVAHITQIVIKMSHNEIDEEGETEPPEMSLRQFATNMIAGGEILLVICLSFLNLTFLRRRDTFQFLFNELINYNKKLLQMVESGKLSPSPDQKVVIRLAELLMFLTMYLTAVLPFGVMASLMNNIEPTNQLIREWLEVEFQLNLNFMPFLVMLTMAAYGVGTTIAFMTMVITIYYMTTTICVDAFTPEDLEWTPKEGVGRCKLVTKHFGLLTDTELIHFFRTQQVLNVLLSKFFRSVLVSFHQVGCLATAVVLLVFMVRFDAVLSEQGALGYVIIGSCLSAPLILIYFQARMGGDVVDVSEEFIHAGLKLVPRKFLFRKFVKSCIVFYIQVAYPYYTIHKETFASFMEQVQDYSMELLLW